MSCGHSAFWFRHIPRGSTVKPSTQEAPFWNHEGYIVHCGLLLP